MNGLGVVWCGLYMGNGCDVVIDLTNEGGREYRGEWCDE